MCELLTTGVVRQYMRRAKQRQDVFQQTLTPVMELLMLPYKGSDVPPATLDRLSESFDEVIQTGLKPFMWEQKSVKGTRVQPQKERRSFRGYFALPGELTKEISTHSPEGDPTIGVKSKIITFHLLRQEFTRKFGTYTTRLVNLSIDKHAMERLFERDNAIDPLSFEHDLTSSLDELLENLAVAFSLGICVPGESGMSAYAIPFRTGLLLVNTQVWIAKHKQPLNEEHYYRNGYRTIHRLHHNRYLNLEESWRNPPFIQMHGVTYLDANELGPKQEAYRLVFQHCRSLLSEDFKFAKRRFFYEVETVEKERKGLAPDTPALRDTRKLLCSLREHMASDFIVKPPPVRLQSWRLL